MPYEGRFEMQHLMLLDHDPDVVAVAWQPFRVHFGRDRKPHTHVPDLFVRYRDGTTLVLDVKGALAADREDNRLVFSLTASVCKEAVLAYRVAAEPDPVVLANVTWLDGYRRQPPHTADAAQALLHAVRRRRPRRAVVERAAQVTGPHPLFVRPVLFHLIWRGGPRRRPRPGHRERHAGAPARQRPAAPRRLLAAARSRDSSSCRVSATRRRFLPAMRDLSVLRHARRTTEGPRGPGGSDVRYRAPLPDSRFGFRALSWAWACAWLSPVYSRFAANLRWYPRTSGVLSSQTSGCRCATLSTPSTL